jgi:protein phosphatase
MNEDAFRVDLNLGLFIVADGMGGHNAGEVASGLAVEAIHAFMVRSRSGEDVTWPYGIDPQFSFDANRLRTALKLANRRVFRAAETRDEYTGMGTTAVAAYVDDETMVLAAVGDSRIYSCVDGKLEQLTTDDSWVQSIARDDPDAIADVSKHPMRHVLTRVVGARDEIDVEIIERRTRVDETLLLCSDGLHGELSDDEIAIVLSSDTGTSQLAERLVAAVLARPARDNVTAVVIRSDRHL